MNSPEILPCPGCKSECIIKDMPGDESILHKWWWAECVKCHYRGPRTDMAYFKARELHNLICSPPSPSIREAAEAAANEIDDFVEHHNGFSGRMRPIAEIISRHMSGFSGAIPEGWQLVPIQPTEEMLLAGLHDSDKNVTRLSTRTWVWGQMLDAAPSPPHAQGEHS